MFSVMSVGTLEDFFGHETQMSASCGNFLRRLDSKPARSSRLVTNARTKLVVALAAVAKKLNYCIDCARLEQQADAV